MSLPITNHNPSMLPKKESKFEENHPEILKNVINTYKSQTAIPNC